MEPENNSGDMGKASKKVPPPVPKKKAKMTELNRTENASTLPGNMSSTSTLTVARDELLACEDLTRLPLLYDDTVLECIRCRYVQNHFYTWAGPTLVATNPCRPVDALYSRQEIRHHHQQVQEGSDRRDAHVYSVAGVAHHRLTHDLGSINQAILVSGESGAGKTESARYMLGYLTHVETKYPLVPRSPLRGVWKDKEPRDIKDRILSSNPILEAFGNAATLRNHNSSRFGKLIRLQYGGRQLRGAEVDTYLLEKTRVTHQPKNERNFHIFYQLMAGVRSGEFECLPLEGNEKFRILPKRITPTDSVNFRETLHAFQKLDFSADLQKEIFQVVAAILYLGNICFAQDESSQATWTVDRAQKGSMESLRAACDLLGVEENKLVESVTVRTISVGAAGKVNVFHKPCERRSQCVERRDALMQLLYQSLFLHIVTFINNQVSAHRNIWSQFLGILDVYGFETFNQNSLEQLCINYANERLQQEFMNRYLATEHQVLKEEGFLGVDIPYTDNSVCVAALDSRISVFTVLNEECQLKRAVREDEACDRVCKALADTGVVYSPSSPGHTAGFVIRHYAGPVKYDAHGLLHKNKDEVPHEVMGLLAGSSQDFIGKLVLNPSDEELELGRRTTRKITTLAKFKTSLDALMKTLATCDLHYVRCIKPNGESTPASPSSQYMLNQLRACGVIETVAISQAGYPVRISYEDFITRYSQGKEVSNSAALSRELARSVLGVTADGDIDHTKCRFGRSRVFLSESALHTFEEVREQKRNYAATCLQKGWRRLKCMREYQRLKRATYIIQSYVKTWVAVRKYKKLKAACILIQTNVRRFISVRRYIRIIWAAVTIQKYFRGCVARRHYEVLMQQNMLRSFSRQSFVSMNSLGYYSMTNSVSAYSLSHSLPDASPCDSMPLSDTGAFPLCSEMWKSYMSPEHRRRLIETEESGIETDTESINGDAAHSGGRRLRKLRRRSQLQKLLGESGRFRIPRVASDESVDGILCDQSAHSSAKENPACHTDGRTVLSAAGVNTEIQKFNPLSPLKKEEDSDDGSLSRLSEFSSVPKMRVATMRKIEEMSGILKNCSATENLQMVLPRKNCSLFFKDGVLSYRRMPVVGIKFHTRRTCLPYSHYLPHQERPRGLWDALH